jgi:hypothetical protein
LCYVCGGTNMGDHWPWEAKELNLQEPFNEITLPSHRENVWLLKTSIIGNYCISHPKGQFSTPAGTWSAWDNSFIMMLLRRHGTGGLPNTWSPNLTCWLTSLNLQQPEIISSWVTAVFRLMMKKR